MASASVADDGRDTACSARARIARSARQQPTSDCKREAGRVPWWSNSQQLPVSTTEDLRGDHTSPVRFERLGVGHGHLYPSQGKATQLLELLVISEIVASNGIALMWEILDRAHEKMANERVEDACVAWESAHHKHGQSMDAWITYLHKCRLELEAHDMELAVSDQEMASMMLRGANLPQEKRAQVLFDCDGAYASQRMEMVLRVAYP